jgi:hypothetical protein
MEASPANHDRFKNPTKFHVLARTIPVFAFLYGLGQNRPLRAAAKFYIPKFSE